MFERFSDHARKVMAMTNQKALRLNHEYVGTEHILLGLIQEGGGLGTAVFRRLDVNLHQLRLEADKLIKSGPDIALSGKKPYTPRAKNVIAHAVEEAGNMNRNYVGTEHLLLGLLKEDQGVAYTALAILGLSFDQVRRCIVELLTAGVEDSPHEEPDPRIASLRRELRGHSSGSPELNDGEAFDVRSIVRGAMVIHCVLNRIELTSDELASAGHGQAAMVMLSIADRLEKAAAELRESAEKLGE